jgi:hypothetical protein
MEVSFTLLIVNLIPVLLKDTCTKRGDTDFAFLGLLFNYWARLLQVRCDEFE